MIGRPARRRPRPAATANKPKPAKTRIARRAADSHTRPGAWLLNHARALFFSLGKLYRNPMASAMTVAVIGIALALPAGLYVVLTNIEQVAGSWDRGVQVTLYLKSGTSDQAMTTLAERLQTDPRIARVKTVTPAQGLSELAQSAGFGDALDALPDNPLPPVVIVYPHLQGHQAAQIRALQHDLAARPDVADAQLNLAWVERLYAIVTIAQRTVWVVGGMLALAVLLVVGNTIRLDILNRRQEIEVAKLIGATNAFIRRPFLYGGFWLGLLGGLLALVVLTLSLWLLAGPVNHLAGLYDSRYVLTGLDLGASLRLLLLSIAFGLGGSWLAVGRHLRDIEPS
ncbi:permease-like cell division protein FtsX [Acidihalobacter prosperus]|uniref:Cell division protein FtsX n=1 Tax=Acidihalobacter prosperus TaxID=160660 RepID=A0A1A6C0W4_9GAMM|nr:permease-like cell division protein FtsX [Acidihalobacter prosperus]OBS08193.1 cell division protein [Acidihalobacter prosperus]